MSSIEFVYFTMGASMTFLFVASGYFLVASNEKNRLTKFMGIIFLFWGIQTIKDMICYIYVDNTQEKVLELCSILDIVAIPLCLFLVKELIMPRWVTLKRLIIHEAPFLIFILAYIVYPVYHIFYGALAFCVVYTTYNIGVLVEETRAYTIQLKKRYSYTERIGVQWLLKILAIFFIFSVVWIASCIVTLDYRDGIYYISSIILWSTLAYYINRQKMMEESTDISANAIDDEYIITNNELKISLDNLFSEKRIFLNPTLTLSDVAREIGTNRTYLSEYLNNGLNLSFFDYINSYRIDYARELLENTNLTLYVIADSSGFNSISTFRRYFQNKYGCSPFEYRKNHLKGKLEK